MFRALVCPSSGARDYDDVYDDDDDNNNNNNNNNNKTTKKKKRMKSEYVNWSKFLCLFFWGPILHCCLSCTRLDGGLIT